METYDIISIVLGAFLILQGLASIFTKKVYGMGKSAQKYTDESLKKFAVPFGIGNVLAGIGLVLFHLLNGELFKIGSFSVSIGLALLVVLLVADVVVYFASKKVLVQK